MKNSPESRPSQDEIYPSTWSGIAKRARGISTRRIKRELNRHGYYLKDQRRQHEENLSTVERSIEAIMNNCHDQVSGVLKEQHERIDISEFRFIDSATSSFGYNRYPWDIEYTFDDAHHKFIIERYFQGETYPSDANNALIHVDFQTRNFDPHPPAIYVKAHPSDSNPMQDFWEVIDDYFTTGLPLSGNRRFTSLGELIEVDIDGNATGYSAKKHTANKFVKFFPYGVYGLNVPVVEFHTDDEHPSDFLAFSPQKNMFVEANQKFVEKKLGAYSPLEPVLYLGVEDIPSIEVFDSATYTDLLAKALKFNPANQPSKS